MSVIRKQDEDKITNRSVARLETWIAVYDMSGRKGTSHVGALLSCVSQDQAAREASARGL